MPRNIGISRKVKVTGCSIHGSGLKDIGKVGIITDVSHNHSSTGKTEYPIYKVGNLWYRAYSLRAVH